MKSILNTIKKMLGISEDDTTFDVDIIANINSSIMALTQIGVGPSTGFVLTDEDDEWGDFLTDMTKLQGVIIYIYGKTRLVFDPPVSTSAIEALQRQISELEWRLQVEVDPPLVEPVEEEL